MTARPVRLAHLRLTERLVVRFSSFFWLVVLLASVLGLPDGCLGLCNHDLRSAGMVARSKTKVNAHDSLRLTSSFARSNCRGGRAHAIKALEWGNISGDNSSICCDMNPTRRCVGRLHVVLKFGERCSQPRAFKSAKAGAVSQSRTSSLSMQYWWKVRMAEQRANQPNP